MGDDDSDRAFDPEVAAMIYLLTDEAIHACLLTDDGTERWHRLGDLQGFVERVDAVRYEVRRTMSVARGRVPRLKAFAEDWGRSLIPHEVLSDPPDVLVIIPHAILHDLPLHLVHTHADVPLGAVCGVCYCSSMTLFMRCVTRNRLRSTSVLRGKKHEPHTARNVDATDVLNSDDSRFQAIANHVAHKWPGYFSRRVPGLEAADTEASRRSIKMDCLGLEYFEDAEPPRHACVIAHGYVDRQNHRYSGLLVRGYPGIIVPRVWRLHGRDYHMPDHPMQDVPAGLTVYKPAELLTAAEIAIEGRAD